MKEANGAVVTIYQPNAHQQRQLDAYERLDLIIMSFEPQSQDAIRLRDLLYGVLVELDLRP